MGENPERPPAGGEDTGLGPLPDVLPVINEFLVADPEAEIAGTGAVFGWIELYAPPEGDVALAGFSLTDAFGDPLVSPLDPGAVIPAGGFLVVDATGGSGATEAAFTLDAREGELGLFWGREPVDLVMYGTQEYGLSSARIPDGSLNWATAQAPTPGASNLR